MTSRPILFSAPMVRAIQAGQKTKTRRIVKPGPAGVPDPITGYVFNGRALVRTDERCMSVYPIRCPYGQPGDQLRVKEAAWMWCERRPNGKTKTRRDKWHYVPMRSAPIWYAADHKAKPTISVESPDTGNQWGWRLKIGRFLPNWASRINLDIVSVRVERLQDISAQDCWAEGIPFSPDENPIHEYRDLWASIHGENSWDANPWVWVVEFRRSV
jgi:hypothetical protein